MAPAQLGRLRPQIAALATQFTNAEVFIQSLIALLQSYSTDIEISASEIHAHTLIPRLNLPPVVINQIEIALHHLVKQYPNQAIEIAVELWEHKQLEYKQIALLLLNNLPAEQKYHYFQYLHDWINSETALPLLEIVLSNAAAARDTITNPEWEAILLKWVNSPESHLKKTGLRGISDLLRFTQEYPLPHIFKIIMPIFAAPALSIQTELIKIMQSIVDISANEAAAFLISIGIHHGNRNVYGFIRKCLILFPDSLRENIRDSLPES